MTSKTTGQLMLITLLLGTGFIVSGCNADAESAPSSWQKAMTGTKGKYHALLQCETSPQAGQFQQCQISFSTLQKAAASLDAVQMEGGMPGHGHGLPTSPVLSLQETGTYQIEGLKYNMPGNWLLGFRVNGELGEDKIIFKFTI